MAVPKSTISRSRRGQRRSHDALTAKTLSQDAITGETHLRHHMTPEGFFKGRQIVSKSDDE
jgi:large subunit ribosomal protein L32